jgi:cytochrome P450
LASEAAVRGNPDGAELGRLEMKVAIAEWLKRIPEFSLDPDARPRWSAGQARGPRELPVIFG